MEHFNDSEKKYLAIDLKSFYASVECVERGLNPLTTNLVVADKTRTEKTICLAVSPSLKSFGISGRARLFEVVQAVKEINIERKKKAPNHIFSSSSFDINEINKNPDTELDYIIAQPQMNRYMETSSRIYDIYLNYISPEDIHVYSIDEVFIDATEYLKTYNISIFEFASLLVKDILAKTGITATVGIGTNLFLCKIAMDIVAKHAKPDKNGVRMAALDEYTYRELLWDHKPLTDFWRVGPGTARRLRKFDIYTMGDIARCSIHNEDLLYELFGVNAELLIDHAWGWEPATISDIKKYRPESNSITSGQVLSVPYTNEKGKLILMEMADLLILELVDKNLVTNQISIYINYDTVNLTNKNLSPEEIEKDYYGREVPKGTGGLKTLSHYTSSTKEILEITGNLFDQYSNKDLLIRRLTLSFNQLISEQDAREHHSQVQYDLFTDTEKIEKEEVLLEQEKKVQKAIISIKKRYGKNSILKGMNYLEGATTKERNKQVGGHKA